MRTHGRAKRVLVAHPGAELYGSDRVLLETVSALIEDGRQVIVTVPVTGPLVHLLEQRGATVELSLSPVLRKSALRPRNFPGFVWSVLRGFVAGRRLIRRHRPDLIFVNTVTVPLWLLLARVMRVPSVAHVHEGEASASRMLRKALAFPLTFATRVVANSEFSVGVLASSNPRLAARSQVIYNAVLGPEVATPGRDTLEELSICYLGRLSPRKGVDVVVDALALLHEQGVPSRLDLYGAVFPGYEWYETQLREAVSAAGLDKFVSFHGFQTSIWEGVAASDVVVVPSRVDEPFGNTAVEAVLAGRPVVASATSGLLEATRGYKAARRVTPDDAHSLAEALAEVFTSWPESRTAAWADRSIATERHSPETYGRQILAVVDDDGSDNAPLTKATAS